MKKALSIIKDIFIWIVVVIAVFMMIFTIVSVSTFDRNDRSIFGYKAFIVLTDSMKKTHFNAGDIVFVKSVDPATLKDGDVITFVSQNEESFNQTITHRIFAKQSDANGNPGFVTYGTTNGEIVSNGDEKIDELSATGKYYTNSKGEVLLNGDATVVTYPYIRGKYQFHIPKLGKFFNFLRTPQGYIVCIFIPFIILILYQGMNCIRLFRRYKKEQLDEMQAERDKIEEERRQSAEMMKELQALKAQLANSSEVQNEATES